MHELSIAQNIVATVQETAQQHSVTKIKSVRVAIGPLSGIVEESLRFCFPIVLKGSGLEGMELIIDLQPLIVQCQKCNAKSQLDEIKLICKSCQHPDVVIISGNDLMIQSIEVE